jgi:hypothetical protein
MFGEVTHPNRDPLHVGVGVLHIEQQLVHVLDLVTRRLFITHLDGYGSSGNISAIQRESERFCYKLNSLHGCVSQVYGSGRAGEPQATRHD